MSVHTTSLKNNTYSVYKYSSYSSNSDQIYGGSYKIINKSKYNDIITKSFYDNYAGCRAVNDCSYKRGKLINEELYNSNKKKVKSVRYVYYDEKQMYISQIKNKSGAYKVQSSKLFYSTSNLF